MSRLGCHHLVLHAGLPKELAYIGAQAPAAIAPEIAMAYVPVALIAAYTGLAVFRRLTTPQFTPLVNRLLLVSGVALFSGAL
jgi:hypothetical protein